MAPTQAAVVVAFFSRCGATESLALAAAVGAVQGRALIRLRRLPDDGAPPGDEDSAECQETLARMRKQYVPPTEADITGNPALILAPAAGSNIGSKEWAGFVETLTRLGAEGKLTDKVGAIVDAGDEDTLRSFLSLFATLGLGSIVQDAATPGVPNDLVKRATTCGRLVAGEITTVQL